MSLLRVLSFVAVAGLMATLSGCATIMGGTSDPVIIHSEPIGASVTIDGHSYGRTPVTVELDTKVDHSVTLSMDGYRHSAFTVQRKFDPWVLGNLFLYVIPVFIDWWDGAIWDFSQSSFSVILDPITEKPKTPTDPTER